MRQRPSFNYSSTDSEYAGSDVDDGVGSDTDLTEAETSSGEDTRESEGVDEQAWLFADDDHSPEHYLRQLETFDEAEYAKEDYKPSSTRLLDRIEEQWNQWVISFYISGSRCQTPHRLIRYIGAGHTLGRTPDVPTKPSPSAVYIPFSTGY
jgi:hypothetical protein